MRVRKDDSITMKAMRAHTERIINHKKAQKSEESNFEVGNIVKKHQKSQKNRNTTHLVQTRTRKFAEITMKTIRAHTWSQIINNQIKRIEKTKFELD